MSILKETLTRLYNGNDEIMDMLNQVDWSALEVKFYAELFERISPQDYEAAVQILSSDLILRYDTAIMEATMSMTRDINNILDLLTIPQTGQKH